MNRLRQERERLGVTLREVQAKSGIKISYLSALERGGQNNPSIGMARRLARCYGVSVDYLFPSDDPDDGVDWRARYEAAARDLEAAHERLEAIRRIVTDDREPAAPVRPPVRDRRHAMTIQTFADAHHIDIGSAEDYQPPACASCGAELDWIECETCAGDGGDFEMIEESAWTEEEWQRCDICDGHGGWWACGNQQHNEGGQPS